MGRLLEVLVPRAGVEPARPFGQRILSPLESASPSLTKRYEPVFTGLRSSRYRFVWLHINTSRHHLSPIFSPLHQGGFAQKESKARSGKCLTARVRLFNKDTFDGFGIENSTWTTTSRDELKQKINNRDGLLLIPRHPVEQRLCWCYTSSQEFTFLISPGR
jgi:hypothetical protein